MGTTSSASPFAPVTFSGISQYSSDFQSILTRAQAIDNIPVQALQNQQSDLTGEDSLFSSLSSAVGAVGSALTTLGSLGSSQALSASSTDISVVSATASGATAGSSYSVTNVTSLASAAAETSQSGYADATTAQVSATGSLQLVYGNNTLPITLAAGQNNLAGLRDAINGLNAGVTATILTAGSGANADYLSISANSPGATTLKLIDDPGGAANNLLTSANQGSNTNFQLNGIPVSEPTTVINDVIPGVTLNINGLSAPGETVAVNVSSDPSQIASALETLVSAYNTLADQASAQIGPTAGLLSGNNVIYQIEQGLSRIVQYQGPGEIGNLANLGVEVGNDGHLTFDQTAFDGLSQSQVASSLALLGSATAGIGGLQSLFNSISDPATGTIANELSQDKTTSQRLSDQISTLQDRINSTETTLNAQLEAADAAVASLASQQSILNSSIQALNFTSYGYQQSNQTV